MHGLGGIGMKGPVAGAIIAEHFRRAADFLLRRVGMTADGNVPPIIFATRRSSTFLRVVKQVDTPDRANAKIERTKVNQSLTLIRDDLISRVSLSLVSVFECWWRLTIVSSRVDAI